MKKQKRLLSLALALVLCLGLLPTATLAVSNDFIIQDGVLKGYRGTDVNVAVPDGVVEIGEKAFRDKTDILSVTFSGSVKKIGYEAFKGCTGLTSVTIPDTVTEVATDAFKECTGLRTAVISKSLVTLPQGMFYHCSNLANVTIPDSVITIGQGAFEGCSALTNISIPGNVTEIYSAAFQGTGLTSLTIPGTVKKVGGHAFKNCKNLKNLTICNGVKELGSFGGPFSGCSSLTSVVLPDSVEHLDNGAFADCTSLTSLTISKSMNFMDNCIVENCKALETLVIPANITRFDSIFGYFTNIKEDYPRLTIYGEANSTADLYAYEKGIPFVVMEPAPDATDTAYASAQSVDLDGKAVEFQCYALKDAKGNLTNYIKLRDLAMLLSGTTAQFQVGWDGSVTITTGAAYTPNGSELKTPFSGNRTYQLAANPTKINGQATNLTAFVLNDDAGGGYTYYKLRDVAQALHFNVGWSAERGLFVESDKPYDPAN